MGKLGPVETQQRALREAQFEERQRQRKVQEAPNRPAENSARPTMASSADVAASLVTNSVTNAITNSPNIAAAAKSKARILRWRAKNPDHYRSYMRDLMRKIRAERRKAA
jgi:hypothetical protein